MPSPSKTVSRLSTLPGAAEKAPSLSNAERMKLRDSLDKARAEIAAGDYDAFTPELLRKEFDAVYIHGKSDAEADAELAEGSSRRIKTS